MKHRLSRIAALMALAALLALVPSRGDGRPREWQRNLALPNRMVWAWERREDLRFLPSETGVAYLAKTITIGYAGAEEHPRMQPLKITAGTPLLAVVRIEHGGGPASDEVRKQIVGAVVEVGSRADVIGVQIDFDARVSERKFYRELLRNIRAELPREKVLSMTGLVSWCTGDDWLDGLPVDEAVPMFFRMGVGAGDARAWAGREMREPLCRGVVGRATDEPIGFRDGDRQYWFSRKAWTEEAYRRMEIGR
jgi:hypothetical protein